MKRQVFNSLSDNAYKTYHAAWTRFTTFMRKKLGIKTPFTQSPQISMYVAYLHSKQLKVSTIRTHLSAIAFMHETSGYPNPTQSFTIRKLLVSYSKSDTLPNSRKPIDRNLLAKLIKSIKNHSSSYNTALNTCMFTLMYHAALRVSEVCVTPRSSHTLQYKNVSITKYHHTKCLKVKFTTFKHCHLPTPPLILHPTRDITCPVTAFVTYSVLRGSSPGPLFRNKNGTPLKRPHLTSTLKQHLQVMGYDPRTYNTHSFRIGKTTDLASQGYSSLQISRIGRWHSNAYQKYIKPTTIHST